MNNNDALKQNLCLPDRPTFCSSYSSTLLWHSASIFATKHQLQDMMSFYGLVKVCDFSFFFSFLKEGFRQAMQMVGEEFLDRLEFYQSSWLPARAVVEDAVKKRLQVYL